MRRRDVLVGFGAAMAHGGRVARAAGSADARPALSPLLPDGTREAAVMERLPGKQPLIKLSYRPPNYEAPITAFRTPITANDSFFVRYHLAGIPDAASLESWSLKVGGEGAAHPLRLTMSDLEQQF